MFNELVKILTQLPTSDKWLFGVAVVILFNPNLAIFLAVLIVAYFIWKISIPLKDYILKHKDA